MADDWKIRQRIVMKDTSARATQNGKGRSTRLLHVSASKVSKRKAFKAKVDAARSSPKPNTQKPHGSEPIHSVPGSSGKSLNLALQ